MQSALKLHYNLKPIIMKTDIKSNAESNINKQDLQNLGDKAGNLRRDGGDDQFLNERQEKVDFSGLDLDVPGRKLPDDRDPSKAKDEENQLYSQGGDGNGHLENRIK